MQIVVTDRESIQRELPVRASYAVISIRNPDATKAKVRRTSGLRAVLHLAFHDAEPVTIMRLPPDIRLFTTAQAKRIWAFVDAHRAGVGAFVVHCHQGMSRSPAVAAALAVYLGEDNGRFWRECQPNRFIYEIMLQTRPREVADG